MTSILTLDKDSFFMLVPLLGWDKPTEIYTSRRDFVNSLKEDFKDSSEKEEEFCWDSENQIPFLQDFTSSNDKPSDISEELAHVLNGKIYFLNSHDLYANYFVIVY